MLFNSFVSLFSQLLTVPIERASTSIDVGVSKFIDRYFNLEK